ncbi:MAG: hypothetical protein P8170_10135, partial [Gemmatimonadota bacterium]
MLEILGIAVLAWIAFYYVVFRPPRMRKERVGGIDPVQAATRMKDHFDETAHPQDLLEYRPFVDAAADLSRSERTDAELLTYANGANPIVACMALEALAGREEDEAPTEELLGCLNLPSWWARFFALRALDARHDEPIAPRVLTQVDDTWSQPLLAGVMAEFLERRNGKGDTPSVQPLLGSISSTRFNALDRLVKASRSPLLDQVRAELRDAARERVDVDLLAGIGLLRGPEDGPEDSRP